MLTTISRPALRRMFMKASILRVSNQSYDAARRLIIDKLEDILNKIAIIVEGSGKKTITLPAVQMIITAVNVSNYKRCPSVKTGKRNRAVQVAKKLQKQGKCALIPKTVFSSMVREILHSLKFELRITADAMNSLQSSFESYMISYFQSARELMVICGTKTLKKSHLIVLKRIASISPIYQPQYR